MLIQNLPSRYVHNHHPSNQIVGNMEVGVQTQRRVMNTPSQAHSAMLSMIEPKTNSHASQDEHWIEAINKELYQIEKK